MTTAMASLAPLTSDTPLHPDSTTVSRTSDISHSTESGLSRRQELAHFLRGRRERITPAQVGLPPGGRRRTPGLRREEVAQLAGVGVTWYTWLEQGRDISVSDSVLEAICRALLLDPHERSHLYILGGAQPPPLDTESTAVTPDVRAILKQLEPLPASLQNARYDILAFNRAYCRMFGNVESIPVEDRNVLWLAFTSPSWRKTIVDWEDTASRLVAQYRAAMAERLDDPTWKCLVKRLRQASPEFVEVWERHEVRAPETKVKRFLHPQLGLVSFNHTNMWMGPHHGRRLAIYTPIDAESTARIEKLMR